MLGFVKNIDKPVAEDSVLVQVLKRQGAIPFVKTNVPQSLIRYMSSWGWVSIKSFSHFALLFK